MKSIRRREPALPTMVYGKTPDAAQAKLLRRAGILLALWDGCNEGSIRFQVNHLVSGDGQIALRESARVPMNDPVRIMVGGREKSGILYSLSAGGCFIETPRASMDGARLLMLFELEGNAYEIQGVVAFSNVPGNLQRPNLPLGMGVHFEPAGASDQARLTQFIRERTGPLEV